ncbi:MAG TPA: hypothetical protein VIE65_21225 [Methylobacter sp.]
MISEHKYHSRGQLLALTAAIILFCASAAAIIAACIPTTNGLSVDIVAIRGFS